MLYSQIEHDICLYVVQSDILYSLIFVCLLSGRELSESLRDSACDLWDSIYGWDRAPCSACTIPNQATKSIEFKLRGNCDK